MTLTQEDIRKMTKEELMEAKEQFYEIEDKMKVEWYERGEEFRAEVLSVAGMTSGELFEKIIFQRFYPIVEELNLREEQEEELAKKKLLEGQKVLYVVLKISVDLPWQEYSSRVGVSTTVELITEDEDRAMALDGLEEEEHGTRTEYKVVRWSEATGCLDEHRAGYGHTE